MGASSTTTCRLLIQRWVTSPRIQICDFKTSKLYVLETLSWYWNDTTSTTAQQVWRGPAWAAVHDCLLRKLVECLKCDTDSDLEHLPAASTSLSKGIEMASKPQRIKLWMACFEPSAEGCLWSLIWLLWESCVCTVGPGETPWVLPREDWLPSRNLDG